MSGTLRVFDPESTDEETRRLSRLAQKCWSPLTIVYNPLKAGSIDSTDVVPHDKAIVRAQNADFVPSKRIQGRPECTIFVGNLSAKTTARSLEEEFSRYGRVVKAKVIEDIITGRSRGYGFVEFSIEGEALKAYDCSNRTWLDGNKIFVDMECGRLLPGWVPRRLGGGFNGRKESGQLRFGCRERPFKKPIKLLSEREINRYFNEILGRKVQNEEKKDFDPKVVRTEEVDTEGRRELREGIHEDADTQISGEKEKKSELKHKERERHREHKKKKRYSRSDYEDEEEETKRTLEKRFVDPSLICIKEKPTKDSVKDDGNGDMKSDSSTAGNFEMGVKKEEPWDEYKDSRKYRKHKEKGRHSRSDCEDEVKERRRTHKKRDEDPNFILIKEEDTTCSVTEDPDIYRDKEELQNHRKHKMKRRLREEEDGERISKKRKKKRRTSAHEDERRRRDEQSGEET
ncbi:hypothetical protein GE061_003449 [Apolygus lucorum]|uniref:U11/U12 small nuclear ribonucleoprotein 35 kDa protein n=1 Tax=Apolygus lucorum TaxID=248454 RepID=A0A8S9X4M8_APOLU|nr:hypothetical protein GE061_003449 [Apolygus lucorum]